jgi:hypothetical protein
MPGLSRHISDHLGGLPRTGRLAAHDLEGERDLPRDHPLQEDR